jgi:hypothetical protein
MGDLIPGGRMSMPGRGTGRGEHRKDKPRESSPETLFQKSLEVEAISAG